MYFLYIIQSTRFGRWYIGVTADIQKRIRLHNSGATPSTKAYRPYQLIYREQFRTVREARQREILLKKSGRLRKELKERLLHRGPIV